MKHDVSKALLAADLAGTFLFGIEGAAAAIRGNLDLLGMMVLAFSTALAGGVVRDLLIGAVPPESIKNWRYAATAFTAAMLTFFFYRMVQAFPATLLMVLDAGGLALFAVAGTEKALEYKIHPFMAALLGTITGVGGGTIRDIFLAHVPRVLQSDIYATAASRARWCCLSREGSARRRWRRPLRAADAVLCCAWWRRPGIGICRGLPVRPLLASPNRAGCTTNKKREQAPPAPSATWEFRPVRASTSVTLSEAERSAFAIAGEPGTWIPQ